MRRRRTNITHLHQHRKALKLYTSIETNLPCRLAFIAFHFCVTLSPSLVPNYPGTGAERLASLVAILFYSWRRETCAMGRRGGRYAKQGRRAALKTVCKQNAD